MALIHFLFRVTVHQKASTLNSSLMKALTVILVEDNESHAELISRAFEQPDSPLTCQLYITTTLAATKELIEETKPDILIIDLNLPDGRGLDLFKGKAPPDYPCILMTSFGNEQTAVSAIKTGFQDYIIKSETAFMQMPKIVGRILREWNYIKEKKRTNNIFHEVAKGISNRDSESFYDALVTSLKNSLEADYVIIGIFEKKDYSRLKILASTDEEKSITNPGQFLQMSDSPNEVVVKEGQQTFSSQLRQRFPNDSLIETLDIEAYIGSPILERSREPLGIVFSLYHRQQEHLEVSGSVMHIYANITAQELQRQYDYEELESLQRQLRQAQKMEALGQLTGGIAHDFNNLLSSIMGYSELAMEQFSSLPPATLKEYISRIYKAGSRAQQLVTQMLMFSRKGNMKKEVVDLPLLVNETMDMLRPVLPSSINIAVKVEAGLPFAFFDSGYLNQMLMNLCLNARDAMNGTGKIGINLSREKVEKNCSSCRKPFSGEYIVVEVTDEGHGIEQARITNIFDPFHTTKKVGEGSGMGLSMVHGVIHETGGHVLVTSEPKIGSSFKLLIPLKDNLALIENKQTMPTKANSGLFSGVRVLVVDDEEIVAQLIGEIITGMGCEVTVETNSESALRCFQKNSSEFDLVITDQTMPNMTGIELACELLVIKPGIPIILCTGFSSKVNAEVAYQHNIACFLMKPVAPSTLRMHVEQILQSSEFQPTLPGYQVS